MNVLGVILARAGSVGLRNKHLVELLGQPVIEYTFDHARQATRLSRVVVSSDCPRVRRLAEAHGLATIARPAELATSDASVQDVMLHAMESVERPSATGSTDSTSSPRASSPHAGSGQAPFRADALVVLYGNVPARGPGVIDRAVEMLEMTGCDSVRSFCPVGKWHPAWMARLGGPDGNCVEPLHAGSIHRRQDLERDGRLLLHDGAVVAVSRASMLRGREYPDDPHAFFGIDRRGFETGIGETVEIDSPRDLYWAEAVLRERQSGGGVVECMPGLVSGAHPRGNVVVE
jgi:CMP-N,N'-diacetyllegionaminic acid synthase